MTPARRQPSRGGGRPWGLLVLGAMAALLAGAMASPTWAQVELDEAFLRVEINATDGDVGLHGKFDGDAWREMKIKSPDGKTIFTLKVSKGLRSQGLTEDFWESDEPTCQEQSLREFLARFPPGTYSFEGRTVDGEKVEGEAELSHALPAAPDISATDGDAFVLNGAPIVIQWGPGTDLGEGCDDPTLIADGIIPDPATVQADSWEVTVEPDEDQLGDLPLRVFTVQLPSGQQTVTVPSEYLQQYVNDGITTFKFEVGAKAGENQTFSEGSFTVQPAP